MSKPVKDDISELVHHDELAEDPEPYLHGCDSSGDTPHQSDNGTVSLGQVNPALQDADTDEQKSGATENGIQDGQTQNGETRDVTLSHPPVYYSSQTGETSVVREPVVIRQANGIHVIRTRECCPQQGGTYPRERPLKIKHIKLLKGFSVLAVILFFPLGIMAMYSAFKCEKEFHEGIMRGNIDLARKYAKRSERLIVFSILGALLVAVIVFAFVERKIMADDDEYWKHRANAHFVPAG